MLLLLLRSERFEARLQSQSVHPPSRFLHRLKTRGLPAPALLYSLFYGDKEASGNFNQIRLIRPKILETVPGPDLAPQKVFVCEKLVRCLLELMVPKGH